MVTRKETMMSYIRVEDLKRVEKDDTKRSDGDVYSCRSNREGAER